MTTPRRHYAVQVWICACSAELVEEYETDTLRCETCGALYDHTGAPLSEEDQ